jgi:hypothetical protein
MTITKLNIKSMFLMVCIEKHRSSLPPSIDRVPAILTPDRRLVTDEDITGYVHGMVEKVVDKRDLNSQQQPRTSPPQELSSAGNTGFSYLDLGADNPSTLVLEDISGTSSFGIFGQEQRIDTPNDEDNEDDSSFDYERFKASRDADITPIPPQPQSSTS